MMIPLRIDVQLQILRKYSLTLQYSFGNNSNFSFNCNLSFNLLGISTFFSMISSISSLNFAGWAVSKAIPCIFMEDENLLIVSSNANKPTAPCGSRR